jgi:hypothetical protein
MPLLYNFVLEFVTRNVEDSLEELILSGAHYLLAHIYDVTLLREKVRKIKTLDLY